MQLHPDCVLIADKAFRYLDKGGRDGRDQCFSCKAPYHESGLGVCWVRSIEVGVRPERARE